MTEPVTGLANEDVGVARQSYRRLRAAAGVADLPALEHRVERLEVGVAESASLSGPLVALVARIEGMLVPVLEARADRSDPMS